MTGRPAAIWPISTRCSRPSRGPPTPSRRPPAARRDPVDAFGLPFFRTALMAILILAGLHAYLGYHVVRRGVIFVDLALAQMAGLGVAIAIVLNLHENPVAGYLLPFGMTLVGAASFAWLRN